MCACNEDCVLFCLSVVRIYNCVCPEWKPNECVRTYSTLSCIIRLHRKLLLSAVCRQSPAVPCVYRAKGKIKAFPLLGFSRVDIGPPQVSIKTSCQDSLQGALPAQSVFVLLDLFKPQCFCKSYTKHSHWDVHCAL